MSNNIFKKPKDAIYVNSANNSESNSISYVNTASSCPTPRYSTKDDSNIFTKSKEALYMQSYSHLKNQADKPFLYIHSEKALH